MVDYSQHGEQAIIIKHFENDLQTTCRFLDIGANDGITFSNTYALSLLGWKGICVEPIPEAFLKLQRLHAENTSIDCINAGVSDETKIVSFHQSNDWIGAEAPVGILSTLNESSKNRFYGMNWTETKAIVFTFEEMEKIYGLVDMRYDFINVDVEGHELIVLKQIKDKLKYCKVICVEKSGNTEDDQEVLRELEENGFLLTETTNDNYIARNFRYIK
jgi:FkbM family methyltransferase